MEQLMQWVANGLMVGGIYALLATSIVLIYKSTQVFNFATGEFVLLGGYFLLSLMSLGNMPIWTDVVLALIMAGVVGLLIYQAVLKPLIGQSVLTMFMATMALSVLVRGLMLYIWGPIGTSFPAAIIPGGTLTFIGISVSRQLLLGLVISLVFFGIFTLFYYRTNFGLMMRAAAEDHQLVQTTGVKIGQIFSAAWGISLIIIAVSGILLGDRLGLTPGVTQGIALKVFPAVLFGGLESIAGAMVGGILVGVIESLAGGLISPKVAEITPYIILLLVLLFRPEGLFGLKRIERI